MADRDRLGLPPEREITPELRARVLERALSSDVAVRRSRRWGIPVLAGLAAAAVVLGVLVLVNGRGSEEPIGPTTPDDTHQTVTQFLPDHESFKVDAGRMSDPVRKEARLACQAASPPGSTLAGHVLASRRLQGPDGQLGVIGYDNPDSGPAYTQYFCTPWGVVENPRPDLVATTEEPIQPIPDARVQGLIDPPKGADAADGPVLYDGAWFATTTEIDSVEARVVVDGVPGEWYRSRRNSDYMFASVWTQLGPEQLDSDVEVQYRALNPDRALITIPGMTSATVQAPLPTLTQQIDIPTRAE